MKKIFFQKEKYTNDDSGSNNLKLKEEMIKKDTKINDLENKVKSMESEMESSKEEVRSCTQKIKNGADRTF